MIEPRQLDESSLEKIRDIGGEHLLNTVIDLFIEGSPARLAAARAGLEQGDFKAVALATHSLKSSAGNLGAWNMYDLADRIEHLAETQTSPTFAALLDELEEEFRNVKSLLEKKRSKGLDG